LFRTIADHCEEIEEHASVKQLKLNSEKETSITLEQCFDVSYNLFFFTALQVKVILRIQKILFSTCSDF
jgi:hypothetical protein